MDRKTITLRRPVKVDGVETDNLTLRTTVTVNDNLLAAEGGGSQARMEVRLIANLLEIPETSVCEMDVRDYNAIKMELVDFLTGPGGE